MPVGAGAFQQVGVKAVVDGFKKYMGDIGKMEARTGTFGKKLGSLLKMGALVGGAAVVGLGVAALKLGGDFDKAFDTIRTGTGATGKAFEGLKDDFKAVFKAIPTDMATASTAIADLNTRLGLTGEPLQQLSKQMIELSRITKTDIATNIESVTRLFGDWDVATEDQSDALDRLFRTSQATGIGVDKLSQLVVQFGAPLRNFGFTLDESTALLAKFDKEGVNTEAVMGGLKIGLGKIAAAGKDPAEAFREVSEQIKNAGSSGEANIAAIETFGSRAGPDMAAAIREGRFEIEDFVAQMDAGGDGILETAKATESWTEKLKILKNKALVAMEPALTGLFTALTNFFVLIEKKVIPALRKWWQKDGPGVMKTLRDVKNILKVTLLPALKALGKILVKQVFPAFAKVLNFLSKNKEILAAVAIAIGIVLVPSIIAWTAATLANVAAHIALAAATLLAYAPIILLVASIALLAFGVIQLIKNWDKVVAFVKQKVVPMFTGLWDTIDTFLGNLPLIGAAWEAVKQEVKDKVDAVIGIVTGVIEVGKEVVSFFKNVFKGEWGAAWTDLKQIAMGVLNLFLDFLKVSFLGTIFAIFASIVPWDWVKGQFEWLVQNVKTKLGELLGAVKTLPAEMSRVGYNMVVGLWDGIAQLRDWLLRQVTGFARSIFNAIKDGLGSLWPFSPSEAGVDIGVGLIAGIEKGMSMAAGKLSRMTLPRMTSRITGEMMPQPQAQVMREAVLAPSVAPQVPTVAGGGVDPGALAAAVASALQGMTVQMDGRIVGSLVNDRIGDRTSLLGRGG